MYVARPLWVHARAAETSHAKAILSCVTPYQRSLHPILSLVHSRFPLLGPIFGQSDEAAATALVEDAAAVVEDAGVHLGISASIPWYGGDDDGVKELFLEQRLDHFNRQDLRTFSQRYFINKR